MCTYDLAAFDCGNGHNNLRRFERRCGKATYDAVRGTYTCPYANDQFKFRPSTLPLTTARFAPKWVKSSYSDSSKETELGEDCPLCRQEDEEDKPAGEREEVELCDFVEMESLQQANMLLSTPQTWR